MSKLFEFIKGPQNFEVIQQQNGVADIKIVGRFVEDENDDTRQDLPFSLERAYARIVNEEDGSFVTRNMPFVGSYDECSIVFEGVPCGGPYAIELHYIDPTRCEDFPTRGDKRRHFFVGDVYIIAGQSNAAGMGLGYMLEKAELGISVLRNLDYWDIATSPFNDLDYAKQSMFITFAKKLKDATNRPIGFVPAAIGGASIERWVESDDGDLYKKLLRVIRDKNISARGVLWYQGCFEAGGNVGIDYYTDKFNRFVNQIRRDLNNPTLSVFTFQLNRAMFAELEKDTFDGYSAIREAQRIIPKQIPNVYVVPTQDALVMADFIHSGRASNVMLGERLALQVLDKEYGIGMGADAPDISKATLTGANTVELTFDNVCEFLYTFNHNNDELPIAIEDKNGAVGISKYAINANTIIITADREIALPAYVSGQAGNDCRRVIIDFGTQLPMLGFYRVQIEKV